METNIAQRNIESTFTAEKKSFTIEASAKAFQILSSNLYTDKPLAIVRELSANALDAHKQANETRPFTITLPSRMNPAFEIRDYGIGMSPETIQTLYTTFFGSDKNHNNDAIGGLGLGSKTPFSYTDTFTLISFWEGIKYTWLCMIQEDGQPSISLVEQSDSDAARGIKYIIPVKAEDFYTFSNKARTILQYFPEGSYTADAIEVQKIEYSLKKQEYGIKVQNGSYPRVVMGPIAYRLDKNALTADMQRDYNKLVNNSRLDIFCDIGDIDIQASREALSYDKVSMKQIDKVLKRVATSIHKDISEKISLEATYLDACLVGLQLSQQTDADFKYMTWKGTPLVKQFDFRQNDGCIVVSGRYNFTKSDALSMSFSKYTTIDIKTAVDGTIMYYDPLVPHNKLRLKTLLLKDRERKFIVFNDEQDMFSFMAATQRMENMSTEDLPLPEKEDVTYRSLARAKVQLKVRNVGDVWEGHSSSLEDINKMENTCWAPLSGGGLEPWAQQMDADAYTILCRFAPQFKVIGVPKSLARKAKHLTLMPIQEYARAMMIEYINTEERYIEAFVERSQINWMPEFAGNVSYSKWRHLPFVKKAELWYGTITLHRAKSKLQELLGWKLKSKTDKQIEALDKPYHKTYHLMGVLNSIYSYGAGISKAEYITEILELIHQKCTGEK